MAFGAVATLPTGFTPSTVTAKGIIVRVALCGLTTVARRKYHLPFGGTTPLRSARRGGMMNLPS
eukprot:11154400-Lingulodinium_polyedra.AAC.1